MSSPPRTPEEIRRDIEHTREELAETAAALAQKADIKGRAKQRASEIKSTITGPDAMKGVSQSVEAHPIPSAAIAAALLGFTLGYLLARGE